MTPATTCGNWLSPFSRHQIFEADITSLNTISLAVAVESAPLVSNGFELWPSEPVAKVKFADFNPNQENLDD